MARRHKCAGAYGTVEARFKRQLKLFAVEERRSTKLAHGFTADVSMLSCLLLQGVPFWGQLHRSHDELRHLECW